MSARWYAERFAGGITLCFMACLAIVAIPQVSAGVSREGFGVCCFVCVDSIDSCMYRTQGSPQFDVRVRVASLIGSPLIDTVVDGPQRVRGGRGRRVC